MVKTIDAVDIADIADTQPKAKAPEKTKKTDRVLKALVSSPAPAPAPASASASASASAPKPAQMGDRDISVSIQNVPATSARSQTTPVPNFSEDIRPSTVGPFYIPSPQLGISKGQPTQKNEAAPTTNAGPLADSSYAFDIVGNNLSVKMLSKPDVVESQWRIAYPGSTSMIAGMSPTQALSPPLPVVRAVPVMRSTETSPSTLNTQPPIQPQSPQSQSQSQSQSQVQSQNQPRPESHVPTAFISQLSSQAGPPSPGSHPASAASNGSSFQRAMVVNFNDVNKKLDQQAFSISSPVSQQSTPAATAHPPMLISTFASMPQHAQSYDMHSQLSAMGPSSMAVSNSVSQSAPIPVSTPVSSVGRFMASSIATHGTAADPESAALPTGVKSSATEGLHKAESTAQKNSFSADQTAQHASSATASASIPASSSTKSTASAAESQSAEKSGRKIFGKSDTDLAPNQQNPNRLSDGFIVLISIALLFVCALLFYFYMRRRRRRRASLIISHSRSLHSSKSSLPSMLPGDETKYQGPGQAHRQTPDSGTSLNFRPKATTFDEKLAKTHAINTLSLHPSSIANSHTTQMLQKPSLLNTEAQEFNATEALSKRYVNYHSQGAAMTTRSTMDARQSFKTANSQFGDSAVGQSSTNTKHARFNSVAEKYPADSRRIVGTVSYDTVSPIRARLPPSPLQKEAGIYGHQGAVGHHALHTHALSSPENDSDNSYDNSDDPLPIINTEFSSKRSLLDTSAANPDMNSPGSKNGSPGTGGKPRKLMRDGAKRGSPGMQGKSKNAVSPGSKSLAAGSNAIEAHTGAQTDASETLKQSKSSNGISIKTMFKSFGNSAKNTASPAKVTEISPPTGAALAKPKADNIKLMPITQPLADGDDAANNGDQGKSSPLLESIESISESYQFAIRHKPPLGPLRVVEPHTPALPDELVVERGHHMFVIGEFADGWVLAVNISRNSECGMIPRRCLFFPTAPFMTSEAVEASNKGSGASALDNVVSQGPHKSPKRQKA